MPLVPVKTSLPSRQASPVEELARWIHEACAEHIEQVENDRRGYPWSKVDDLKKARYRAVAKKLLEDPPPCLRTKG